MAENDDFKKAVLSDLHGKWTVRVENPGEATSDKTKHTTLDILKQFLTGSLDGGSADSF